MGEKGVFVDLFRSERTIVTPQWNLGVLSPGIVMYNAPGPIPIHRDCGTENVRRLRHSSRTTSTPTRNWVVARSVESLGQLVGQSVGRGDAACMKTTSPPQFEVAIAPV